MIKFDKFIQGINNKDPRAWKELYRFYYGALCNYSSSIINEASVAEDIVQECLLWSGNRICISKTLKY